MARASGSDVMFGTPERGKDLASRAPQGRPCAEPGCTTVLSTYNESPTCFLHTKPAYRHPLQRN